MKHRGMPRRILWKADWRASAATGPGAARATQFAVYVSQQEQDT